LRNRSRAAHLAEKQDFHLKVTAVVCHSQHVSNPDLARSFGGLPVGLNSAEFAGSCRECSCLEESRGPKPFVHSYRGHDLFSYPPIGKPKPITADKPLLYRFHLSPSSLAGV
jgi:hypothetical protein